jgi:putative membrane protein
MAFVIKVLVTAAAVWVAVELVDGLEFDGTWVGLIVIAAILGVVNAFARPIVTILSLPLVLLTLGLFLLVINALMLSLTIWISEALSLGLSSTGFGATLFGAIIITVVSWIGEALLGVD